MRYSSLHCRSSPGSWLVVNGSAGGLPAMVKVVAMSCIGGGLSQLRICGALDDMQAGLTVLSMPANAGILNLASTRPATFQPCVVEPRTRWWLAVNVILVSMQQVGNGIVDANAIDKTCSILQLLRKRCGSTPLTYSACVMRSSTVAKSKAFG